MLQFNSLPRSLPAAGELSVNNNFDFPWIHMPWRRCPELNHFWQGTMSIEYIVSFVQIRQELIVIPCAQTDMKTDRHTNIHTHEEHNPL